MTPAPEMSLGGYTVLLVLFGLIAWSIIYSLIEDKRKTLGYKEAQFEKKAEKELKKLLKKRNDRIYRHRTRKLKEKQQKMALEREQRAVAQRIRKATEHVVIKK